MRKIFLTLLLTASLLLTACHNAADTTQKPPPVTINISDSGFGVQKIRATTDVFLMDTLMTLTVYSDDEDAAKRALEEAVASLTHLDQTLSTAKSDSNIARINADGHGTLTRDGMVLMNTSLQYYRDTNGLFNIAIYPVVRAWGFTGDQFQVPEQSELQTLRSNIDANRIQFDANTGKIALEKGMAIDFGAIAKGYAGEQLIDIFKKHGITSALLSLGGNVQVLGQKPDGSPFRVAIQNPLNPDNNIGIVSTINQAVITSGSYQRFFEANGTRYHHIIDPRTGYPAEQGLASVSIIASDGTQADALSTSLFIMGLEAGSVYWRAHADDFEAIFIENDGTVHITEGLAGRYEPLNAQTPQLIARR